MKNPYTGFREIQCKGLFFMKTESKNDYLVCEQEIFYALLMVSAGMMGAYTYVLRGGVFCNAQTANV